MAIDPRTLKPTIERHGQKYVDQAVYKEISKAKPLALAVNMAVRSMAPKDVKVPAPRIEPIIHALTGYRRHELRWVKPPQPADTAQ